MISKEDLLKMLSLPEGSDLFAVREAVRALEGRALDAVSAQAVMGWNESPVAATWEGWFYVCMDGQVSTSKGWWKPTDSLDAAAALMPKIEEMGLTPTHNAFLISIATGDEVTPLESNCFWALTDQDLRKIANATARQRTEAAVLAVAGRVMQC